MDVFKVITIRNNNSGKKSRNTNPEQFKDLIKIYKETYSKMISNNEIIYYNKLLYILSYKTIDMVININNNIQEHYIDHE